MIDSDTERVIAGSDAGLARWFTKKELEDRKGELHEDTLRQLERSGVLGKT